MWLALLVVVLLAAAIDSFGISRWPLADDEAPTLVEMGKIEINPDAFSVPPDQIGKLPRALPVWYGTQRFALSLLPDGEVERRLPSVAAAVLTLALLFVYAARTQGLWYAAALALVVNTNLLFVLTSQINRFYAIPLLLLVLTFGAIITRRGGPAMLAVVAVLSALCALSHNVIVAVLIMTFLAAVPAYLLGRVPMTLVLRSGVAALVSVALYFSYIRPIVNGWSSTGNPTPTLVSFVAYAGMPTLVLALFGVALALHQLIAMTQATGSLRVPQGFDEEPPLLTWWATLFAGSLVFLQITSINWNPRYFIFFMPAMWVLAANAITFIAGRLGERLPMLAWYGGVAVLLLPTLVSHFADGSRHDYRAAAAVVLEHVIDNEPILSDDAETISYYLPPQLRTSLRVRTKVTTYPTSEFLLVCRANAWMAQPRIPERNVELLAEISRRRIDQFSHVLRVYRVRKAT